MSLQTDFTALANPIFDGRVYPFGAEESPLPPYATFFRVAVDEQLTLDENGGDDNLTNTRLQVNVWALSYTEAQAKAGALKAALKTWAVTNLKLGEQDEREDDTKLYGVMLDLSIWHP